MQKAWWNMEERVSTTVHVVSKLDCPSYRSWNLWDIGQEPLAPGNPGVELFYDHVRRKCRHVSYIQLSERELPSVSSRMWSLFKRLPTGLRPCVGVLYSAMGKECRSSLDVRDGGFLVCCCFLIHYTLALEGTGDSSDKADPKPQSLRRRIQIDAIGLRLDDMVRMIPDSDA